MTFATRAALRRATSMTVICISAGFLAACATSQPKAMVDKKHRSKEYFAESEYGVKASPRVTNQRVESAARRRPRPARQALQGPRQDVLSEGRQELQEDGPGLLVRRRLPRPPDRQRRNLRHDASDGRASDHAAAELCARHQYQERQLGHRARQRPRPLLARPPHRPVAAAPPRCSTTRTPAPPR